MKRIIFTASAGGVRSIPIEETKHFEAMPDGTLRKLQPVAQKFRTVPDMSDRTVLRIYKEDLADFVSAVQWRTGQSEINISTQPFEISARGSSIPVKLEREENFILLPVFGTFQPELSADDIHEIVKDWRLLSGAFPTYQNIFTIKTAENRFAAALLDHLIETQTEIVQMLHEMQIGKANLKPLPPWIARVLELRKQK